MKISFSPFVVLAFLIGLLLELGLISGCTSTSSGDRKFGFQQSTRWEFYQEVGLNAQGKKEASHTVNMDSLFGWVKALWVDGNEHVPDAADGVPDPVTPPDDADPPDEALVESPPEVTP